MKYVRRGTPPAPIPSGKAHSVEQRIERAKEARTAVDPIVDKPRPQPRDDADQLVNETQAEAIDRRIEAVIDHIVTPEPDKPLLKPKKAVKKAEKPAVVTKSRARPKSPAKKK